MQNRILVIVTLVAALALAALFNPSPEKHRARIRETTAQRSQLAGMLGVGALTAFVSSYHSLGVASYTTVDHRLKSVGAYGIVVVVDD